MLYPPQKTHTHTHTVTCTTSHTLLNARQFCRTPGERYHSPCLSSAAVLNSLAIDTSEFPPRLELTSVARFVGDPTWLLLQVATSRDEVPGWRAFCDSSSAISSSITKALIQSNGLCWIFVLCMKNRWVVPFSWSSNSLCSFFSRILSSIAKSSDFWLSLAYKYHCVSSHEFIKRDSHCMAKLTRVSRIASLARSSCKSPLTCAASSSIFACLAVKQPRASSRRNRNSANTSFFLIWRARSSDARSVAARATSSDKVEHLSLSTLISASISMCTELFIRKYILQSKKIQKNGGHHLLGYSSA